MRYVILTNSEKVKSIILDTYEKENILTQNICFVSFQQ